MNNFEFDEIDCKMDIISETSSLTGNFSFGDFSRIEGKIEGEIESNGVLIIGEKATLKANIQGYDIIVNGLIHGNVSAKNSVSVGSNAKILGCISSPKLTVSNGGIIVGKITMSNTD